MSQLETPLIEILILGGILLFGVTLWLCFTLYLLRETKATVAAEKKELLAKVAALERHIAVQAEEVAKATKREEQAGLDKALIEAAIDAKLGASSWQILTLVFENPAISNREIAKKVSLSTEGVSSSLRRMYSSFDVKASSNKKVALVMKAVRLSKEQPLKDSTKG